MCLASSKMTCHGFSEPLANCLSVLEAEILPSQIPESSKLVA